MKSPYGIGQIDTISNAVSTLSFPQYSPQGNVVESMQTIGGQKYVM